MKDIDFFDVDHTITRHSTGVRFLFWGVKLGIFPVTALMSIPFYYFSYKFGWMTVKQLNRDFQPLKGKPLAVIEDISSKSFRENVIKDIYGEVHTIIEERKSNGREIVLATSSIDVIVSPIADFLGVQHILANSLAVNDGICTGKFSHTPVFGAEKKRRVLEFIEESGTIPAKCSFYTDSFNDLPLLEVIGEPVAVNPDQRLMKIAPFPRKSHDDERW